MNPINPSSMPNVYNANPADDSNKLGSKNETPSARTMAEQIEEYLGEKPIDFNRILTYLTNHSNAIEEYISPETFNKDLSVIKEYATNSTNAQMTAEGIAKTLYNS